MATSLISIKCADGSIATATVVLGALDEARFGVVIPGAAELSGALHLPELPTAKMALPLVQYLETGALTEECTDESFAACYKLAFDRIGVPGLVVEVERSLKRRLATEEETDASVRARYRGYPRIAALCDHFGSGGTPRLSRADLLNAAEMYAVLFIVYDDRSTWAVFDMTKAEIIHTMDEGIPHWTGGMLQLDWMLDVSDVESCVANASGRRFVSFSGSRMADSDVTGNRPMAYPEFMWEGMCNDWKQVGRDGSDEPALPPIAAIDIVVGIEAVPPSYSAADASDPALNIEERTALVYARNELWRSTFVGTLSSRLLLLLFNLLFASN